MPLKAAIIATDAGGGIGLISIFNHCSNCLRVLLVCKLLKIMAYSFLVMKVK